MVNLFFFVHMMHDNECHPFQSLGQHKLQIDIIKSAFFD